MSLAIIDDPPLHVSVSQLKCWQRCPRQYELKYRLGVAPEFTPRALAFGGAFHAALAAHYTARRDGASIDLGALVEVFRTEWDVHARGDVPLEAVEGGEDPVDCARRMLGAFTDTVGDERVDVVAVEEPFSVALHDPDTGEVLQETLTGFIDLIVMEDGHPVIVEHKTSSKKYTLDQLTFDVQPTAYAFAMRARGWSDVGLRFQVITKAAKAAVQIEDVIRSERDEDDFLRTAVGVLRAIDAGVSFPVRGWMCRTCPWRRACGAP
jgi:hypothetical protein